MQLYVSNPRDLIIRHYKVTKANFKRFPLDVHSLAKLPESITSSATSYIKQASVIGIYC
jgi:hypothetical protein